LVGPKVTEDRSLKAIVELSPFFSYRLWSEWVCCMT
jgi:hypothetical protein